MAETRQLLVRLAPEIDERVRALARSYGITPQDLVRLAILDVLARADEGGLSLRIPDADRAGDP